MQRPLEITSGIAAFATRTPTLPPATHTNSYALGDRDVLLVEPATPYGEEQRAFVEWVRGIESTGRRLVAIFLTHHHPDHVGGAEVLARELGLPLWAHRITAERLPRLPVARRLEDGETLTLGGPTPQHWNVLHTPGHAPGHLCLHEPDLGYVVAGDMVATEGTILVEPSDGDMAVYLDQLRRLRALASRVVLPAHGAKVEDPDALFGHYVHHRLMREAKVVGALEALGASGGTLDEIVPLAYDDAPKSVWGLARLAAAAHLVKLVGDGVARTDGERHFREAAGA